MEEKEDDDDVYLINIKVSVEKYDASEPVNLEKLDGTWRLQYTSASDVVVLFEAAYRLPIFQVPLESLKTRCY